MSLLQKRKIYNYYKNRLKKTQRLQLQEITKREQPQYHWQCYVDRQLSDKHTPRDWLEACSCQPFRDNRVHDVHCSVLVTQCNGLHFAARPVLQGDGAQCSETGTDVFYYIHCGLRSDLELEQSHQVWPILCRKIIITKYHHNIIGVIII